MNSISSLNKKDSRHLKQIKSLSVSVLFALLMFSTVVQAQEDFAKKSQNPVGDLISLPKE